MNWKHLFREIMLEQGYEYYCDDAVIDFKQKEETITALIDVADCDTIKAFLASALMNDIKLLVSFQRHSGKVNDSFSLKYYFDKAADIYDEYSDRNGWVGYSEAWDFACDLLDMIDADVGRLIDRKEYMKAFKVLNFIFLLVGDIDMDDSDGGISMIGTRATEMWLEMSAKADEEDKEAMFDWFVAQFDGTIIDYMEDYMEQVLTHGFTEKKFAHKKLKFAEEMILKAKNNKSEWTVEYTLDKWSVFALDQLEELDAGNEKIREFCKDYWESSGVRSYYVDFCIKTAMYDEALAILDESLLIDENYRGRVNKYNEKKKEIFKLKGDEAAFLNMLWEIATVHKPGDITSFNELKSQYSEDEWTEIRKEYLQRVPQNTDLSEVFSSEKMYDELLESVLKCSGIWKVSNYKNVLKRNYSKEILEKYKVELDKMAVFANNRKDYRNLVRILKEMLTIEGGKNTVAEIIDEWRIVYRRRPAMMEELGRLQM